MEKQPTLKNTFTLVITIGITALVTSQSKAQRAEDIIFTPEKIKTIPGHGMSKEEYPYDEGGKYRREWVNTWAKSPVSSSTTVRYPIPKSSREHSNYAAIAQLKNQGSLRQLLQQQKLIAESNRQQNNRRHTIVSPPKTRHVAYEPPPISTQSKTVNRPTQVYNVPQSSSQQQLKQNGFIGPYNQMVADTPAKPQATQPIAVAHNKYSPPTVPPTRTVTVAHTFHKVQSGDTLYNISRRYGTTVSALKHANGLTSDLIRVGQNLKLALAQHALGVPRRG